MGLTSEQAGRAIIFTFTESTDEAVDQWGQAAVEWIEQTPVNAPFLMLVDVSARNVTFSQRARQTSIQLFKRFRQRQGRVAFIFSSRTAPYYARIFFATLGRLGFEIQFFHSCEQGLNWLRELES
ncbi:MAG: hypothetical protein K8L99_10405 [Anaerolineae bacterium]|nr:hypothetical protein [Anaerolineae bacterium]